MDAETGLSIGALLLWAGMIVAYYIGRGVKHKHG